MSDGLYNGSATARNQSGTREDREKYRTDRVVPFVKRDEATEKLLPQNVDAEASVLGCIVIAPEAVAEAAEYLTPNDFYREAHRAIFEAAVDLYEANGPADFITICDELARRGLLEMVGGTAFVGSLANQVPNAGNVGHYAKIVQRTAVLRDLIGAAGQIAAIAYNQADADVALEQAGKAIGLIDARFYATRRDTDPLRPLSLAEMLARPKPEPLIDRLLLATGVSMVAGDGGCGKSVLLADMAIHVALGRDWNGHKVKPSSVLIIAGEGGTGFAWRVQAWLEQHNLTIDDLPNFHIVPHAVQVLDAMQRKRVIDYAKELPDPPTWIIVETLSQTSSGADQNDNALMASYVRACRDIADQLEGHCTFSHHAIKTGDVYRGASALRDDVETVLMVARSDNASTVHCAKQRDGWDAFADFSFTANQVSPAGADGLTYGVFEYLGLGNAARENKPARVTLSSSKRAILTGIGAQAGITRPQLVAYCQPYKVAKSTVHAVLNSLISDGWVSEDMHGLTLTDACPGLSTFVQMGQS